MLVLRFLILLAILGLAHPTSAAQSSGDCKASYPTLPVESLPCYPDLDCWQIPYTNFLVYQPDPHFFDSDYDGVGCET